MRAGVGRVWGGCGRVHRVAWECARVSKGEWPGVDGAAVGGGSAARRCTMCKAGPRSTPSARPPVCPCAVTLRQPNPQPRHSSGSHPADTEIKKGARGAAPRHGDDACTKQCRPTPTLTHHARTNQYRPTPTLTHHARTNPSTPLTPDPLTGCGGGGCSGRWRQTPRRSRTGSRPSCPRTPAPSAPTSSAGSCQRCRPRPPPGRQQRRRWTG